jgi:hypothetical protein
MFPGSETEYWDKEKLREKLKYVIEFQQKTKCRIMIGEFGVVRWAPGREKWMKDVLELFEEYGWDWAFHSLNSWNGWNPTFGPNDPETGEADGYLDTETFQWLKAGWARNNLNKSATEATK